MDIYEEAAQKAEREGTTVEQEMVHIDKYLADEEKFLFGDEEDEIKSIIKQGGSQIGE